jgi:hypothetical protein
MESISKNSSNSFQCIDALEVSLSIEKQGFIYYDKAAKSAVDPRVRAIFFVWRMKKKNIYSLSRTRRAFFSLP